MYALGLLMLAPCISCLRLGEPKKTFFVAIPKTSSSSFKRDAKEFISKSWEGCYEDHKLYKKITMLRNPRAHVLSQYYHCATSNDHMYGHSYMPAAFPEWIDAWSKYHDNFSRIQSHPFCCYNPMNLMASRFTCGNGLGEQDAHYNLASVEELQHKIASLDFVGLAEHYDASLCLLRIRRTQSFPEECDCGSSSSNDTELHNRTHGTAPHTISDYSEEVWKRVDELTILDRQLYEMGASRFFNDVREVEEQYNKRILCHSLDSSRLKLSEEDSNNDLDDGRMGPAECSHWAQDAVTLGIPFPN